MRMAYETIIWEETGAVGRLTLNRPETLNAWTADFGRELKRVVEGEAARDSVRAVIVTGAGRGFSSGADLKAGFEPAEDDGMPDIRKELHEIYHPVIAGIRRLPKPVVAAVNGPAVGIGCSLALSCDLVMAAESAFLGLAFVNIGLMPDGGCSSRGGQGARVPDGPPGGARLGAAGARMGAGQLGASRRRIDGRGEHARRRSRRRPHPLLRKLEAGAQPVHLRRPGRPARPGGRAPARPRTKRGFPRGRRRVRGEARARVHRRVAEARADTAGARG